MKKILAFVLVLTLVLGLVACSSNTPANNETKAPAGNETKAPEKDNSGKTYKVAMICDSSISDGGWGTACYNAMLKAAEERGWETAYTDSIAQNEYYDSIVSYCSLGYDMIYAPGNQYTDAVLQAAEEYPDITFALLNGAESTPGKATNKNVTSLLPDAQQIGWIAGALAGLMTESGTIAFIGGMELDTTKAKYQGFGEAAKFVGEKAGKTVTLLDCVYAGSFNDSAKGLEFRVVFIVGMEETSSSATPPRWTPAPARPSTSTTRPRARSRSTTSASPPTSSARTSASSAPRSPTTPP